MRRTSCATPRVFTGFALASALCLPAAAIAAQFDYFIKLPPIEGDSGKGESHGGEIEIQSFSWGATQTSHGTGAGGMGAGKVSMQDISAPSATSGAAKAKGEKGGTEDINIGVGELQETGEAEITLKGSKIGENSAAGGVQVAAGDVDGDGRAAVGQFNPKELSIKKSVPRDAASGLATGKRQHKPLMLAKPLASGSVTVRGKFPSCTVGTRYPSLELGARGARYTLADVVITSCGGSAGEALPMEEVSFNYAKIKT